MTAATATKPRLDLRERIRRVMDVSLTADPKVIADEVLNTITTGEAAEALAECLPDYVRVVVNTIGRRRPAPAGSPRSWKTDAAKAYAEKLLRQRVDVAGDGTGWKFLSECDAEDLHSVAAKRREQAAELTGRAAWFEKIAGLLEENDADTVGALPEPVLISLASNGEIPA